MHVQVMHGVAVGTKVNLVGIERLVQRCRDVADIGHKGGGVFLGHAGDVIDVLLGGHDYAALMTLLLKQDELAGRQVKHGDAKGIDERVVGPAHAVRAIGMLFHGDPFDLDNDECRFCGRRNPSFTPPDNGQIQRMRSRYEIGFVSTTAMIQPTSCYD